MINYDIEWSQLIDVAKELQASVPQFKAAVSRACNRTAATLRKMSSKGLKDELQLRTAAAIRKRLKSIKLRANMQGMQLWYGLNDMPVSSFKGRPRQTSDGAQFRNTKFAGAFVAKSGVKGKQTVFKRRGKQRLPIVEQLLPIKDQADIYIEDEIFVHVEQIFWQHFRRDLAARVKYNLKTSDRWA